LLLRRPQLRLLLQCSLHAAHLPPRGMVGVAKLGIVL
jgi:hypothetical protein